MGVTWYMCMCVLACVSGRVCACVCVCLCVHMCCVCKSLARVHAGESELCSALLNYFVYCYNISCIVL